MGQRTGKGGMTRWNARPDNDEKIELTLVDVGGVGLLPRLGALLLLTSRSGLLASGVLLLGGLGGDGSLGGGGLLVGGLGRHFDGVWGVVLGVM